MEAGRELDALVAEKVMGWDVINPEYVPSHSTEIEDAWDVVERMRQDRWTLIIYSDYGKNKWFASFASIEPDRGPLGKEGDTAPHAICLAALKAVGGA